MLSSIFSNSTVTITSLIICILSSLVMGIVISFVHMKTTKCSKNFAITLVLLPMIVSFIIMMVNGNLGTSVAILGAFSLVRFRSVPGTSKEILSVFLAMTIGLAIGVGEVVFAIISTLVACLIILVLNKAKFGNNINKKLIITIPEDLDYTNLFDDILSKYVDSYELEKAKTTNMGSLFEITYLVNLKNKANEKEFIDELRVRNGNLKIILTHNMEGDL